MRALRVRRSSTRKRLDAVASLSSPTATMSATIACELASALSASSHSSTLLP
jgi:hypothetical protein